uniref:Uncharacterized protein n=1 Tax=Moniliophthora roreri TaxID=221103 RepID=A0A0W0GBA5_MONRR
MRSFALFATGLLLSGLSGTLEFEFQRIRKNDTILLIIAHQIGHRNNILAHTALGKIFNLSTILTTSTDDGVFTSSPLTGDLLIPCGQDPKILDMHSDAPIIRRQGEVNTWDNPDYRAAVKATGKK